MDNLVLIVFILLPLAFLGVAVYFIRTFKQKRHWAILISGNLLVLGFLMSLTLLGLELYFRYIFDSTDSIISTRVSQRWYQRHYKANKSGFRDNIDYINEITPGKRRITFLGDSFSAGQGVELEERFANLIRKERVDWEIHTLAIPGWNTGNEIKVLEAAVKSGYQLDIVILVYFPNDISDLNSGPEADLSEAFDRVKPKFSFIRSSFFLDHLYFRTFFFFTPEIKNYSYDVINCYQGKIWEQQQERFQRLQNLIAENQGELMVINFPFMQDVTPNTYPHQQLHTVLKEYWQSKQVPYLDLLDAYSNNSGRKLVLNRFDAHPNRAAHRIAASNIDAFLRSNLTPSPAKK